MKTWLEARREGGQSRDSLNLAGVELSPKRYDDIGTGTQTLQHTNQWGGHRPRQSNSDGHSLNLATRRAPSPSRRAGRGNYEPSPWVASRTDRYPETGERTRPERGRRFMRSRRPRHQAYRFGQIFCFVTNCARHTQICCKTDNDPSAGSPTETLLRLLLSPSDRVRASSRPTVPALARQTETNPRPSLNRSIDSSDGRCVQRAGT